jgi:hypothetical protein
MKRFFSVLLACLLIGVVLVLLIKTRSVSPPAPETISSQENSNDTGKPQTANGSTGISAVSTSSAVASTNATAQNPSPANPGDVPSTTGERAADASAAINLPPATLLQNVRRVVRQYGEMFGGNPVGTNPEITAALTGNNPKQINFLTGQPGMRINGNGELVDAWGTPYFFHQLSGTEMEIHSAGPDKIMWTSDDLVTK